MRERSSTSSSSKSNSGKSNSIWLFCSVFIFMFCAASALFFIGEFYEKCASLNKINLWSKQRFDEYYALEENSVDMIFVGSSHSYCTFDPEKINPALGVSSYQLGLPNQLPDSTYYTVREALRTQKPKTIVMELYWAVLDIDFEPKQIDYLFKALQSEDLKEDFYKAGFPLSEKVKYSIKAIRYQQEFFSYANKRITDFAAAFAAPKTPAAPPNGTEYYRSLGYTFCDKVMTDEDYEKESRNSGIDGSRWKMSDVQEKYILKIAALCEENGIELVFVTAPVSHVALENIKNYDKIHASVASLAEELGVPYLDFNLISSEVFSKEHFRDPRHLNDAGVSAADKYFVKWYNENINR